MSQFLDCFSEPGITSILSRVCAAMRPGSRVFILKRIRTATARDRALLRHRNLVVFPRVSQIGNSNHSADMTQLALKSTGLSVTRAWYDIGLSHSLLGSAKA